MHHWKTLQHDGVGFPEKYRPHGVPVKCGSRRVAMSPAVEEYVTHYARALARDPKTARSPRFVANFVRDLLEYDPPAPLRSVESFRACDFGEIMARERNGDLAPGKPSKKKKVERYAVVDGKRYPIANPVVDMPGLFVGRGDNAHAGRIKRRLSPSDVELNASKVTGSTRGWKAVHADRGDVWVARWPDPIYAGRFKYAYLADASHLKQLSDRDKFDAARYLSRKLDRIRRKNAKLISQDGVTRQLATCLELIFAFAIRAGTKKVPARQVYGATSLLVEHARVSSSGSTSPTLKLSFLAKDSVPYSARATVVPEAANAVRVLSRGKAGRDPLFPDITESMLNDHLRSLLDSSAPESITCKTIRTCMACRMFEFYSERFADRYADVAKSECSEAMRKTVAKLGLLHSLVQVARYLNHVKAKKRNVEVEDVIDVDALWSGNSKIGGQKSNIGKCDASEVAKLRGRLYSMERDGHLLYSTTLKNYVDPRCIRAFSARFGVPLAAMVPAKLSARFGWVDAKKEPCKTYY